MSLDWKPRLQITSFLTPKQQTWLVAGSWMNDDCYKLFQLGQMMLDWMAHWTWKLVSISIRTPHGLACSSAAFLLIDCLIQCIEVSRNFFRLEKKKEFSLQLFLLFCKFKYSFSTISLLPLVSLRKSFLNGIMPQPSFAVDGKREEILYLRFLQINMFA